MQGEKLLLVVIVAIVLFTMSFVAVMGTAAHAQEKAKTGADPTDFISRYEPSYEHKDLDNGSELNLFVLRTDLALRRNFSLRLDFPLANFDPSSAQKRAGFDSETGFGDLVTQLIYKPYSGKSLAAIFGLRVDWDTATEDEVGQGGTTFAPLGAVAWYPRRNLIFVPIFQWFLGNNLDNDPLPGERDRNELSYRQLVIWQPMHKYVSWLMLDPELIIDFEDDDETLDIGIEYGKMITKTIAVFIKPTLGVGNSDTDWAIKIGFRHMFPTLVLFK